MNPLRKLSTTETSSKLETVSVHQIDKIISYFPIGNRIKYYPEYQPNLTMQSIVLGYQVNKHIIFNQNHLKIQTSTSEKGLITLQSNNREYEFSKIHSFCILLPGKAGEEYKLNFLSKASLGSRGQFRNGNAITLVARFQEKGVVEQETSVRESYLPKDGYYKGHRLALLEISANNLKISEQRTHHRLQTNIPANIHFASNDKTLSCILSNYSELSLQVKLDPQELTTQDLRVGDRVTVTLKLDQLHRTFVISGVIMRSNQDNLIITMQEILSEGEFKAIELMDALDIKASLLQHPASY